MLFTVRVVFVMLLSLVALLDSRNVLADLATAEYWHNPGTVHSSYNAARDEMLAVDEQNALLKLDKVAALVSRTSIADRYKVPNERPIMNEWEYLHQSAGGHPWVATEAAAVGVLLTNYESDAGCPAASWVATGSWQDTTWWLNEPTRSEKDGTVTRYVYHEPSQSCILSEPNVPLLRQRDGQCPQYYVPIGGTTQACTNARQGLIYRRMLPRCQPTVGNPCGVSTGTKFVFETDYAGPGLEFKRSYNSHASFDDTTAMGAGWAFSYQSKILGSGNYRVHIGDDGSQEILSNVAWGKYGDSSGSGLFLNWDSSNSRWELAEPSGDKQVFNGSGKLLYRETANGQKTVVTHDADGRVDYVTGPFGHVLDYVYDVDGRLEKVILPDGTDVEFRYATAATSGRTILDRVTRQDGTYRDYLYEKTDELRDAHITGILDGNGDRFATYDYDANGLVTLSEHGVGQKSVSLSYTAGTTTVTESGGSTTAYTFETYAGLNRKLLTRTEAGASKTYTYPNTLSQDRRGRPKQIVDESGSTTKYTYNLYHPLTVTEAFGTPKQRLTSYGYLSSLDHRPTSITTPSVYSSQNRTVTIGYDTSDRPTTVTESGFSTSGTALNRSAVMTYNTAGQVLTVDGFRTDLTDVTTLEYYECTTGNECGQIKKLTDAKGHITTFDTYDASGRLLQMTGPNGLVAGYTYDLRGQLRTVTYTPTAGTARVTTYTYDNAGLLKTVTQPDGLVLTYDYDTAHQLKSGTDNLGNRIEYDYDNRGNLTDEDVRDTGNILKRAVDNTYDLRNRLNTVNAGGFTSTLVFDAVGNLESETDPATNATTHSYDALQRLELTVDALLGNTDYDYDVNDNLISVTAPNNAVTTYEYNDFSNLTKEVSPDRGTTTYTHDAAGNVLTKTDARGKLTTYTYDALNRLTQAELDNLDTIDFEYDVGTHAKGRLNKVTDTSGNTQWVYNQFGEITSKTQTIGAVALTVSYGYDPQGRMTSMTLPSGKVVTYGFNTYQPASVTVDLTTVLTAATYEPFGPVNGWTWGDATTRTRVFDLRGLETSHSLAADTRTLGYNNVSELITLDDTRHDLDFDYDVLGRLFDFDALGLAPLTSQDFSYDANGNRQSFTEGSSYAYTVTPNTNRVATVAGPVPKTYVYDAAGNITSDGSTTYTYDDRGRMVTAGTATYTYNGLGQRVKKDNGTVTLFAYDEAGNLIGEYDSLGNPIREHVWFDRAPVAVIVGSDVHYVHTDHLGTPRAITDSGTVVWRWESDPFGSTLAQEDPDGGLTLFTYNLRFPGQYYDSESGLHYNYFRTYDPSTGRYLESDPIGLEGGLNTYAYVDSNPLRYVDYYGLSGTLVLPRPLVTPRPAPLLREPVDPVLPIPKTSDIPNFDDFANDMWPDPKQNQKCRRLLREINGLRRELDKRWEELQLDRWELPERLSPNESLKDTKRGHRTIINEKESILRRKEREYDKHCRRFC